MIESGLVPRNWPTHAEKEFPTFDSNSWNTKSVGNQVSPRSDGKAVPTLGPQYTPLSLRAKYRIFTKLSARKFKKRTDSGMGGCTP